MYCKQYCMNCIIVIVTIKRTHIKNIYRFRRLDEDDSTQTDCKEIILYYWRNDRESELKSPISNISTENQIRSDGRLVDVLFLAVLMHSTIVFNIYNSI